MQSIPGAPGVPVLFTEMPPLDQGVPARVRPKRTSVMRTGDAGDGRTVALITKDNTAGLTVDMDLMDHFLTENGFTVRRVDWKATAMPVTDIGIFLELFSPGLAKYCRKTVGIFNPEWFMPYWKRHLRTLDQVWCKSRQAQDIFVRYNRMTYYTGFFGRYMHNPDVPRVRSCLHLQGRSTLKNTEAVLEAWRRYPDLPPLTVITVKPIDAPDFVTVHGRMPGDELNRQLNTHRFHLCPSRAEGWGHYITEALSTGAHVVTTDASPMNEHIQPAWGTLLMPSGSVRRYDVREYRVDPNHIAEAVFAANRLTDAQLDHQAEQARTHFLRRNNDFRRIALTLLEKL
jgi:glycosyltransferase involved in cell wall biosynthesis